MSNEPVPPPGFTLIRNDKARRVYARSWAAGDDLSCAYAKGAPRDLPCGPPVALVIYEDARGCRQTRHANSSCACQPKRLRRVVCLSHIPELKKPHEITAEAQRVAQERLASAHWDEWQSYLREEVERQVAEQLEFADPEIRRIVLGGES